VNHHWNALGALANSVLRQAAQARDENVSQLRVAEAAQGKATHSRRLGAASRRTELQDRHAPAQLELPLV
jgi:hypothetical protein